MASRKLVQVIAGKNFMREAERLAKKFRHIADDVEPLTDQLQRGETPGDQVKGIGHAVYKVRVPNRDMQRGKSGGYRVIYYIRTADTVYLVTIYAKSERQDISANEVRQMIADIVSELEQASDTEGE